MDDIIQCGNDLKFLEWWLHHKGDPRSKVLISELAAVTQGLVQVLTSSQITNTALSHELRTEATKTFVNAANKLANSVATARAAA